MGLSRPQAEVVRQAHHAEVLQADQVPIVPATTEPVGLRTPRCWPEPGRVLEPELCPQASIALPQHEANGGQAEDVGVGHPPPAAEPSTKVWTPVDLHFLPGLFLRWKPRMSSREPGFPVLQDICQLPSLVSRPSHPEADGFRTIE